ncbi:VOC family protein [Paenibacillus agricola]|uniref:VOC family protein n=1 Tax=Paenibacillus agricola TaxID=2716264 RepID=A0ABX0JH66_9BACL|nr:VOC family protein [Paenibacillus agricola]NHN35537.1 VOC family protein [Paenibacillus agricola]
MWKKIECVAVYTDNIEKSVEFYQSLGLMKAWEAFQDEEKKWKLIGMRYPEGDSQLVLKNNPNLNFAETEVVVEDVRGTYELLVSNPEVKWIRAPFRNPNGGYVAVMQAPDGNVFVLVGK